MNWSLKQSITTQSCIKVL